MTARATLGGAIERFDAALPYKHAPFASRAWGHPLHSLCSYQGKLKPGLAHWLIREFTTVGDTVLDPLGGVGTIPLEACLQGRRGISNDMSPFAATVARAKLQPPSKAEAYAGVERLRTRMSAIQLTEDDVASANFGLNASVRDYYHPDTLDEVLRARRAFLKFGSEDPHDAFVWAALLHVLHGNRPYALSRTSHPITPFSPTGPATYKNVVEHVRQRIDRILATALPDDFVAGVGVQGDFRDLDARLATTADAIITSPPFLGMRFDRPNWLRLWFCGWQAEDFHERSLGFLERQQTKSLDCYRDFFEVVSNILKPTGILVIHIGSGKKDRLVDGLCHLARDWLDLQGEVVESVAGLEQHGLRDKGNRTTAHHLLFFVPV